MKNKEKKEVELVKTINFPVEKVNITKNISMNIDYKDIIDIYIEERKVEIEEKVKPLLERYKYIYKGDYTEKFKESFEKTIKTIVKDYYTNKSSIINYLTLDIGIKYKRLDKEILKNIYYEFNYLNEKFQYRSYDICIETPVSIKYIILYNKHEEYTTTNIPEEILKEFQNKINLLNSNKLEDYVNEFNNLTEELELLYNEYQSLKNSRKIKALFTRQYLESCPEGFLILDNIKKLKQ